MKNKILQVIITISKYTAIVFSLLVISLSSIMAEKGSAQAKSVKEVLVSVNLKNSTLKQVFKSIEEQTEFNFIYSEENVQLKKHKVSLDLKQSTVETALLELSRQTGLKFRQVNERISATKTKGFSGEDAYTVDIVADVSIAGKITDENGEGLPGASVVVKGSTSGTTTDLGGNYKFNAPDDAVLVISYVGYLTQEISIAGRSTIDVSMEPDAAQLEEIVVVGYGTQRKRDLTGSIASVNASDLDKVVLNTPDQALQGRVAGVQVRTDSHAPGGGISVQIRGTSSLSASSQPLYVIDGFPISNDFDKAEVTGGAPPPNQLNSIDPSNIASIQILKDASATAIYGSRANNGVVIITTKRGASGQARFDYENSISVSRVGRKYDLLNATEWFELVNEADDLNGNTPRFSAADIAAAGEGTDWQDVIFRNAVTQRHKLSLSGGNEAVRYMVSGNLLDQQGLIVDTGFKRYGFNVNLDANVSKKLTLTSNMSFTSSSNDQTLNDQKSYSSEPSIISTLFQTKPHVPAYDADGNLAFSRDYPHAGGEDTPLYMAKMYDINSATTRFLGGMALNYEIFEGLNFKTQIGMDNLAVKNDAYYPIDSRVARGSSGKAEQETQALVNFLNENTLEYKKTSGKHQFSILGGFTYQREKFRKLKSVALGFPSDFYSYHNLGLATNPQPPSSSTTEWKLMSYLGRANYIYDNKYMFTATVRYDGSSKFGVNNKYGFFTSGSAAWVLSEESFIKDMDVFSQLKLRVGYGQTGNERIGLYKSISTVASSNNVNVGYILGGNQVPVAYPSNIGNPDLTWEKGSDLNIGLDMGFFDDRINLTVDVYNKKTTDLLLNLPIPQQSGFSSVLTNIGEMQNKGYEISLSTVNINNDDFSWTSSVNYSHNKNKITSLGGATDHYFAGWVGGGNQGFNNNLVARNAVGHSVGSFWGSIYDGIWKSQEEIDASHMPNEAVGNSNFRDLNEDGQYNAQDDSYIGDPNPDFIFGITNDFTYKQFSLNIFIYGEQGQEVANLVWRRITGSTSLLKSDREQRWHPVNNPEGTTHPANRGFPGRLGTHNVEDGSFVRVKNITLSYDLPVRELGISWLRSLQLSVAADNPLILTSYRGYDPEVNSYGSTNDVKGVDRFGYPSIKGYRFGLRVGF